MALDRSHEAARLERAIDRLHLTSVRTTQSIDAVDPARAGFGVASAPGCAHTAYGSDPIGCVRPRDDEPSDVRTRAIEYLDQPHVTNLGTLLDVLA